MKEKRIRPEDAWFHEAKGKVIFLSLKHPTVLLCGNGFLVGIADKAVMGKLLWVDTYNLIIQRDGRKTTTMVSRGNIAAYELANPEDAK